MPLIETTDRTGLFVTDWGSGQPVMFTHAWGLRSDQWTYQIPALAPGAPPLDRLSRPGCHRPSSRQ